MVSPDYPEAPLSAGQGVGTLTLKMGDEELGKHDLVAATDIEESGFFGRLFGSIKLFFVRLFA